MKKKSYIFVAILTIISMIFVTACGSKKEEKKTNPKQESKIETKEDMRFKTDYMILVNKDNKLPSDWESRIELVDVKNGLGEMYKVEKKTAEAYKKLKEDLANDGITIELDSTYRTVKEQQDIWDEFEAEKGLEYTKKYVAVPGTSEHHTGLAVDIKIVKNGVVIDDNDDMTAETEIFSKIHKKLAKYGFILRYPVGKESITGYGAEVWHFRYIDSPSIAKDIMDKGLTFEEYIKSK